MYLDPNSPTCRHIIGMNILFTIIESVFKNIQQQRYTWQEGELLTKSAPGGQIPWDFVKWRPPLANQHCHEQTWQPATPQIRLGQKIWLDKEVKLNPFFSACVYFPKMAVKRSIANTQKACPVLARIVWWMFPALSSKISGAAGSFWTIFWSC